MPEISYDASLPLTNAIRIPVFVEDEETMTYWENAFTDLLVTHEFVVASGSLGVSSRIQDHLRKHPDAFAFGIRDRDYDQDRHSDWCNPMSRSFVLRRHEIENYCLEWQAISEFARQRLNLHISSTDIAVFAREYALEIVYAVAYNSLICKLEREVCCAAFKQVEIYAKRSAHLNETERSKTILSCEDAHARLLQIRNFEFSTIDEKLNAEIDRYKEAIESAQNDWIVIFPGKEILAAIRCKFFARFPNDDSLIRFVAQYQRDNNSVPDDLKELKGIIVSRS